MKETIEYYYNYKINDLFVEESAYFFYDNDEVYYFVRFFRTENELKEILSCVSELKNKNIFCHEIVLNNQGKILTKIDDAYYILMNVKNKNINYSIVEMIQMNKKLALNPNKSSIYRNNWALLWSTKIDYIESQIKELKLSNPVIKSVNYYIGLAENAIYYINNISKKYKPSLEDKIVLSHKRIYFPNYGLNYLNPLTFIFDLEIRDIAEYIKSTFFAGDDAITELQTFLKSKKLTIYSYNMLFARLLFPSYYFDLYEKIVNNNEDSEKIIKIISKCDDYENFLKKAYKEISLYAPLENITWLIY